MSENIKTRIFRSSDGSVPHFEGLIFNGFLCGAHLYNNRALPEYLGTHQFVNMFHKSNKTYVTICGRYKVEVTNTIATIATISCILAPQCIQMTKSVSRWFHAWPLRDSIHIQLHKQGEFGTSCVTPHLIRGRAMFVWKQPPETRLSTADERKSIRTVSGCHIRNAPHDAIEAVNGGSRGWK